MGRARKAPAWEPPASSLVPDSAGVRGFGELEDVPAAVVCAHCGSADCLGECFGVEEPTNASKVVAIVPWERPVGAWPKRLWSTARLTTVNHEAFFGSLPAGDLGAAAIFAVTAELVAVGCHMALTLAGVAVVLPELASAVVRNPELFALSVRAVLLAVPGLALLMAFLHAVHGLMLDLAARRHGGRKRLGLRFGFYSCGWDLVTLPLGLLLLTLSSGAWVALQALPLGLTLPPRAARAYLAGVQHLEPRDVVTAGRFASAVTGLVALVASTLFVVGLVAATLW